MSQPTPGPYVAIKGADGEPDRWGVYADGPLNLSEHWHIATVENGAPGDTLDTEESNARLFAAAPDLLDACEADAAFWDHFRDCRSCAFLNNRKFCDVGQALREQADTLRVAAIEKAKGETP